MTIEKKDAAGRSLAFDSRTVPAVMPPIYATSTFRQSSPGVHTG
jgi:hypothetical protein